MSREALVDINRNKEYTTLPLAGTFGYISPELLADNNNLLSKILIDVISDNILYLKKYLN